MTANEPGRAVTSHNEGIDRARTLVLDAFARARQTGKATWDVMTTAVLKNRLLDLTNREFIESDYGARDMVGFVRSMPDLLEVTPAEGPGPPVVRLRDRSRVDAPVRSPIVPDDTSDGTSAVGGDRLRPDIWRAAMAWRDRGQFVFDDGRLRPRVPSDDALPVFEPVTETDFLAWKEAFVQRELQAADPSSAVLLDAWRGVAAPSRVLGKELQDRWMTYLRQMVATHVEAWFRNHGLAVPDDLYVTLSASQPMTSGGSGSPPELSTAEDRRLKEYVLRSVHAMTVEELRALPIPAAVAARLWH